MKYQLTTILFLLTFIYIKATYYTITDEVYFDVTINDKPIGRIVIGLFGDIAPKTVENFLTIATTGIEGKTYAGTKFHRVIKKFMIQGGDIVSNDGLGSLSIYGEHFDDENFEVPHVGPYFISMANSGPNTNGCQFFITTIATPWLDGHHTVFGKVVDGTEIVFKIEQIKTNVDDEPIHPVVVYDCGLISLSKSYLITDDYYENFEYASRHKLFIDEMTIGLHWGSFDILVFSMWSWFKATAIPLSFSFSILGLFHWMMKKLDV